MRITPLEVSSAAFVVALTSLIVATLTYRRATARIAADVYEVRVRPKPVTVNVQLKLFNKGLAETDVTEITFWMYYKQWPLPKKDISGESFPARIKANGSLIWTISLVEPLADAVRMQVDQAALNPKLFWIRYIIQTIFHHTSYLYFWMPAIKTLMPPTVIVRLGNGRYVRKTVWRAAFAITSMPEFLEYALRPRPKK